MIPFLFPLLVLIFSVAIHETAHGWVAYKMGDPTAKYEGRITLNPLAHLDPIGSFVFPLFTLAINYLTGGHGLIFGWAKPVPINPYNFRDYKKGEIIVSLAGPLANFSLAVIVGLLIRFLWTFQNSLLLVNIVAILVSICLTNLALTFFNLLPLPPLDGSHLFLNFLPESAQEIKSFLQQYGFLILLLLFYLGIDIINPVTYWAFKIITGISL